MTDHLSSTSPNLQNKNLGDEAKNLAGHVGERFQEKTQQAYESTKEGVAKACNSVKDGTSKTLAYVRSNPGKSIGIAAAVGGIIALALKGKNYHKQRTIVTRRAPEISGAEKAALAAAIIPLVKKFGPWASQQTSAWYHNKKR